MNLLALCAVFILACCAVASSTAVLQSGIDDVSTSDSLKLAWAVKRLVGGQCCSRRPGLPGPRGETGPTGDCGEVETTVQELQNEIRTMKALHPDVYCLLGMKDNTIPDSAITVSSMHAAAYCQITNSRLDHHGAWCVTTNTPGSQWIQVDLGRVQAVTGVVTQGQGNYPATNEWVKSFKIEYGTVDGSRQAITENNNAKIFAPINFNKNTRVVTRFPEAVQARYIRIIPMSYYGHISMRFDVINC